MAPEVGAIPAAVARFVDSVEHRLAAQQAEDRDAQARRNQDVMFAITDLGTRLTAIETGVRVGSWVAGGVGAIALTILGVVLNIALRGHP